MSEIPAGRPRIHVLADLTESQRAAIRRIPAHKAVECPTIEAGQPVSRFLDEEVYREEQQRLFRRAPVPVTLSSYLNEPGAVLAQNGYGLPLLVMRDKEGVARVFLNACTHKGSTLVDNPEPVSSSRVTCPYHAWTFALSGKLAGVARAETFENLDKGKRNLTELPSREAGGFIWAILNPAAEADFGGIDEQLVEDLEALDIHDSYVFGRKTFHIKANWKQVLEPFLEGYHVQRLHARSVGPLFADVPTITERLGNNLRQTSGKIEFSPADVDDSAENVHKTITHAYQVFPNGVVVTSPWYISIMILMPNGVGETTVDYFMLTLNPADNDKSRELYSKSYDMVLDVFGNEDFKAAEQCYAGLSSGALRDVVYSGLESTILMYYETLDAAMR